MLTACLLLALSLAAAGAPSTNWTLSNESESPLEADETSLEVALPNREEFDACRRHHPGHTNVATTGCGTPSGALPRHPTAVVGHRLSNGLTAPLRC
jgi:hypothetical protein